MRPMMTTLTRHKGWLFVASVSVCVCIGGRRESEGRTARTECAVGYLREDRACDTTIPMQSDYHGRVNLKEKRGGEGGVHVGLGDSTIAVLGASAACGRAG